MKKLFCIFLILLIASLATAQPNPIDTSLFSLTTDMTSLKDAVDALSNALDPRRANVSQIMVSSRERLSLCHEEVYGPLELNSEGDAVGFCWEDGDDAVSYWYPQGITTTHDALKAGKYENRQLILVCWYHDEEKEGDGVPNKGARVTFVDWDSVAPDTYRHVLLVMPTSDGDFTAVENLHAGGIMWYGDLIYVVDTNGGLRVFDMDHIYEVDTSDGESVGKQGDSYYAYGYQYIMPQTGWLNNTGEAFRYSWVALDRASEPDSFIVGEFCEPENTTCQKRVVRYPLDYTTRLPGAGDGEKTTASEAIETGITQMQGGLARDGRFWFASSKGPDDYGVLSVWDRDTSEVREHDWAIGPEDMSYWEDADGPDRLWTVTEYPNSRIVVSVPQSKFN